MSNLVLINQSEGQFSVRTFLRQLFALPPLTDPAIVSPNNEPFALATTTGTKRERNEDRAAIVRVTSSNGQPPWLVLAICDGMGGMIEGAKAAEITLSTFLADALAGRSGVTPENFRSAAESANKAVYSELAGRGGATLSAVGWDSRMIVTVNAGDSRIWAMDKSGRSTQLTQDDSIAAQLAAHGEDAEEARPGLLQFIGVGDDLALHVNPQDVAHNRSIVLTSDGAHDAPGSVIGKIICQAKSPVEVAERLVRLSLWSGGMDNATAVCMNFAPVVGTLAGTVEIWTPAGYWRLVRIDKQGTNRNRESSHEIDTGYRQIAASDRPAPLNESTQKVRAAASGEYASRGKRSSSSKDATSKRRDRDLFEHHSTRSLANVDIRIGKAEEMTIPSVRVGTASADTINEKEKAMNGASLQSPVPQDPAIDGVGHGETTAEGDADDSPTVVERERNK